MINLNTVVRWLARNGATPLTSQIGGGIELRTFDLNGQVVAIFIMHCVSSEGPDILVNEVLIGVSGGPCGSTDVTKAVLKVLAQVKEMTPLELK